MCTSKWRIRPTCFALITALTLPAAALRSAAYANEVQKPEVGAAAETKADSSKRDSSPGASAETLKRVLAAWRAREERVKSFHVSWDSRVVWPKGYTYSLFFVSPVVGGLNATDAPIGGEAVELSLPQSELWVDGHDRLRDEFFQIAYQPKKGWVRTGRVRHIVDGHTVSHLTTPTATDETPEISIWHQTNLKDLAAFNSTAPRSRPDACTIELGPLALAFRPLDAAIGWSSPENCRVVGENVVNGVRCIQIRLDDLDRAEMCWVDPSRDYVVIRWEKRQGRMAPISVAIEYQNDKTHGWIPSRWKRQLPGENPELKGMIESTVTRCTINERLPADTFARSYPKDARVCDVSAEGLIRGAQGEKAATGGDSTAKQQAAAGPSMDAIVAAWAKRQERAKSLKFSWSEEQASSTAPDSGGSGHGPETILIDGDRVALVRDNKPYPPQMAAKIVEYESKVENGRGRELAPPQGMRPSRVAFDGINTRSYRALDNPTITGRGTTAHGFAITDAQGLGPEPMLLMFRPFDQNLGRIKPDDYRVAADRGKIGDVDCVIIETTDPGRIRKSYWLDPARDYLVLRRVQTVAGRDVERMDISYRNDSSAGWVPEGCRFTRVTGFGQNWRTLEAKISDVVINPSIARAEFLADFPKGTKVRELPSVSNANTGAGFTLRLGSRTATIRPAGGGGGTTGGEVGGGGTPVRRPQAPRREPTVIFKPIFDPFADAFAEVKGAIKVAKQGHKPVLVLCGNNSLSDSLKLYAIFKENPDVSPMIEKEFVLVLVDLYSETGSTLVDRYFRLPQRVFTPHVAVLDSKGEVLQFQALNWLFGEDAQTFDAQRIKRLLAYYLQPEQ